MWNRTLVQILHLTGNKQQQRVSMIYLNFSEKRRQGLVEEVDEANEFRSLERRRELLRLSLWLRFSQTLFPDKVSDWFESSYLQVINSPTEKKQNNNLQLVTVRVINGDHKRLVLKLRRQWHGRDCCRDHNLWLILFSLSYTLVPGQPVSSGKGNWLSCVVFLLAQQFASFKLVCVVGTWSQTRNDYSLHFLLYRYFVPTAL